MTQAHILMLTLLCMFAPPAGYGIAWLTDVDGPIGVGIRIVWLTVSLSVLVAIVSQCIVWVNDLEPEA